MEQTVGKTTLDTKDRILDAAEDVFNGKGYSKTTLNDIAEATGMTRGAIYWNFKNKEDLFNEMCERARALVRERLQVPVIRTVENPIDFLKVFHARLVQVIVENTHIRKVFAILMLRCEQTEETSHIYMRVQKWRAGMKAVLKESLVSAQEKGFLPKDLDVTMAVEMLYYTYWGMVRNWVMTPQAYDLVSYGRRQLDALFEMFHASSHMRLERE